MTALITIDNSLSNMVLFLLSDDGHGVDKNGHSNLCNISAEFGNDIDNLAKRDTFETQTTEFNL